MVCSVRASWIPLSSGQDKRDIECRFADEGDGGMEFYQPSKLGQARVSPPARVSVRGDTSLYFPDNIDFLFHLRRME